jgi:hypothetical protein
VSIIVFDFFGGSNLMISLSRPIKSEHGIGPISVFSWEVSS